MPPSTGNQQVAQAAPIDSSPFLASRRVPQQDSLEDHLRLDDGASSDTDYKGRHHSKPTPEQSAEGKPEADGRRSRSGSKGRTGKKLTPNLKSGKKSKNVSTSSSKSKAGRSEERNRRESSLVEVVEQIIPSGAPAERQAQ